MNATLNGNGRARKSLASQIDRLDSVLDGLADNLNDAVAMAVTEAVGTSVRETVAGVLTEVLTNPRFLAALRDQLQPAGQTPRTAAQAQPNYPQRLSFFRRAAATVGRCLRGVGRAVFSSEQRLCQGMRSALRGVSNLGTRLIAAATEGLRTVAAIASYFRPFRAPLLSALVVGVVVGTAVFFAEPWLAAALAGVGGFGTAVAVHGGLWLRRFFQDDVCTSA